MQQFGFIRLIFGLKIICVENEFSILIPIADIANHYEVYQFLKGSFLANFSILNYVIAQSELISRMYA